MKQESLHAMLHDPPMQYIVLVFQFLRHDFIDSIVTAAHGEPCALLSLLFSPTPLLPGQLGACMRVSNARITAVIHSLEKKGLVVRQASETDRRKVLVSLTAAGKVYAESQLQWITAHVRESLEKLGDEDAAALLRILRKLVSMSDAEQFQVFKEVPHEIL